MSSVWMFGFLSGMIAVNGIRDGESKYIAFGIILLAVTILTELNVFHFGGA